MKRRRLKAGSCVLAAIILMPWSTPSLQSAARVGQPNKNQPPKAWVSAKGICCFPLTEYDLPRTGGQLVQSMLNGWHGVLSLPAGEKTVEVVGGRYPSVDSFHVDLSGSVVNPNRKAAKIADDLTPTSKSLYVSQFQMVCRPLIEEGAKLNVQVIGTNVRLDLQKDKEGRPMLMLADADSGEMRVDILQDDLEKLFLANAKEMAAKHGLRVRKAEVSLRSVSQRQLSLDLHLSVLIGFIPAGMHFTSRVDIDDKMCANISNLSCQGDEVLGPLIVSLIRPALNRYNNVSKPLLSLPGPKMKLTDLQIRAGERLELYAKFEH